MSNTIDCSIMSHLACEEPAPAVPAPPESTGQPAVAPSEVGTESPGGSYDCINHCASSLGVVTLVEGAVSGLGCLALPPACPAFLAAVPITILEACDSACRELEKP